MEHKQEALKRFRLDELDLSSISGFSIKDMYKLMHSDEKLMAYHEKMPSITHDITISADVNYSLSDLSDLSDVIRCDLEESNLTMNVSVIQKKEPGSVLSVTTRSVASYDDRLKLYLLCVNFLHPEIKHKANTVIWDSKERYSLQPGLIFKTTKCSYELKANSKNTDHLENLVDNISKQLKGSGIATLRLAAIRFIENVKDKSYITVEAKISDREGLPEIVGMHFDYCARYPGQNKVKLLQDNHN